MSGKDEGFLSLLSFLFLVFFFLGCKHILCAKVQNAKAKSVFWVTSLRNGKWVLKCPTSLENIPLRAPVSCLKISLNLNCLKIGYLIAYGIYNIFVSVII